MDITDITDRFLDKLKFAAEQWVLEGSSKPLVDTIMSVQRDSYEEGYETAMQVSEDNRGGASKPKPCKGTHEKNKLYNDPVQEFLREILAKTVWDALSYKFLFAMYDSERRNNPGYPKIKYKTFKKQVKYIVCNNDLGWYCMQGRERLRGRMRKYEPLLCKYAPNHKIYSTLQQFWKNSDKALVNGIGRKSAMTRYMAEKIKKNQENQSYVPI